MFSGKLGNMTHCLVSPCTSFSLREKLRLDPDTGVSAKYLLASLESAPDRLTKDDQVGRTARLSMHGTV